MNMQTKLLQITAFSVGITLLIKELFEKTISNSSLNSHVYWDRNRKDRELGVHWRKVKGGWRGKKEQGMVGREGSIEAGEERERGRKRKL